mmetsp:Transcript_2882/g.7321  ORF Transcript_2882/g.7321 Transcript_2882/m.7321 type:complete len:353 (-) Transcript_2882:1205-2263(-)
MTSPLQVTHRMKEQHGSQRVRASLPDHAQFVIVEAAYALDDQSSRSQRIDQARPHPWRDAPRFQIQYQAKGFVQYCGNPIYVLGHFVGGVRIKRKRRRGTAAGRVVVFVAHAEGHATDAEGGGRRRRWREHVVVSQELGVIIVIVKCTQPIAFAHRIFSGFVRRLDLVPGGRSRMLLPGIPTAAIPPQKHLLQQPADSSLTNVCRTILYQQSTDIIVASAGGGGTLLGNAAGGTSGIAALDQERERPGEDVYPSFHEHTLAPPRGLGGPPPPLAALACLRSRHGGVQQRLKVALFLLVVPGVRLRYVQRKFRVPRPQRDALDRPRRGGRDIVAPPAIADAHRRSPAEPSSRR